MTADQLTILVAEDHPLYRRALTTLLAGQDGWDVVAEAEDGIGAVTAAHTIQPDVVLMDLNLPGLDGIEATRRIVAASPHIAVLVLTMYDDDSSVFAAVRAGARGYLLKGADQADIVRAVTAVAGGEAIFGPSVARRIIDFFAAPPGPQRLRLSPSSTNSPRESTRYSISSLPGTATPMLLQRLC